MVAMIDIKIFCNIALHSNPQSRSSFSKVSLVCRKKGNQQQLDHCLQVLENVEDVAECLDSSDIHKAEKKLEEGTELVRKRVKAISCG